MGLMPLDDVTGGLRADVYVGHLAIAPGEAAVAAKTGVLFEEVRPFDGFRASCLLAQPWPAGLTADGVFWVENRPDTCFKLRIADGQAAYRPLGRWLASRPSDDRVDPGRCAALTGRPWHAVYGDRIQRIWFDGLAEGWQDYERMFIRGLVKPGTGFKNQPTAKTH